MRVVIAPDSFGGTLSPVAAAEAMAAGWSQARPDDEVRRLPLSDGGEGLTDALLAAWPGDEAPTVHEVEVVGPAGLPVMSRHLVLADGTVVFESATACGLALLPEERRDPRNTTTWGVGQLLGMIAEHGGRRILVGLGGSATVDGGAGALSGLGWRVTVEDGSGLKVGGTDLGRVAGIAPGWVPRELDGIAIELLADVDTALLDAPRRFGPQKGADADTIAMLEQGLQVWADVVEATFDRPGLRDEPGTGAAGGLGFALAAAHGATLVPGGPTVADLVGLDEHLDRADVVVTGEGRLDAASLEGKVVGTVLERARARDLPVVIVCGSADRELAAELGRGRVEVLATAPQGIPTDPAATVRRAVAAAADRLGG